MACAVRTSLLRGKQIVYVSIRNQLDVTYVLSFISPLQVLNMFRATVCPSSEAGDCVVLSSRVGIVPWLQEGCQKRLTGSVSIEEFVAQRSTNSTMDTLTANRF
jgi:hypothetical protein